MQEALFSLKIPLPLHESNHILLYICTCPHISIYPHTTESIFIIDVSTHPYTYLSQDHIHSHTPPTYNYDIHQSVGWNFIALHKHPNFRLYRFISSQLHDLALYIFSYKINKSVHIYALVCLIYILEYICFYLFLCVLVSVCLCLFENCNINLVRLYLCVCICVLWIVMFNLFTLSTALSFYQELWPCIRQLQNLTLYPPSSSYRPARLPMYSMQCTPTQYSSTMSSGTIHWPCVMHSAYTQSPLAVQVLCHTICNPMR